MNYNPKFFFSLLAAVLMLTACSTEAPRPEASGPEGPGSLALADEAPVDQTAAETTAGQLESSEPEPPEALADAVLIEPEWVEAEIIAWERGEQDELLLTVVIQEACSDADDCIDAAGEVATIIAAEGLTRFVLPLAIAPETIDVAEVSQAEFEAYLSDGQHPAAVDPQPGDRFLLLLDPEPELEPEDGAVFDSTRIALEVVLLGADGMPPDFGAM